MSRPAKSYTLPVQPPVTKRNGFVIRRNPTSEKMKAMHLHTFYNGVREVVSLGEARLMSKSAGCFHLSEHIRVGHEDVVLISYRRALADEIRCNKILEGVPC